MYNRNLSENSKQIYSEENFNILEKELSLANNIIKQKENKISELYEKLFICKEIIVTGRSTLKLKENQVEELEKINSKLYKKFKEILEQKEYEITLLQEINLKSKEQNLDFYQKLLKCKEIIDENNNIIKKNNNEIYTLKEINETDITRILELEKETDKLKGISKIEHQEIINSEHYLKTQNLEGQQIINQIAKNLNDRQLKAITTTEGFVRIIAGAGAGKTKALTSRYAYIIEALGISPCNIFCVTFTNKAAQEMRNRVKRLVGEGKDTSYISTYHGFCVRVLREDINKILFPKDFIIMDVEDQKIILREIYNDLNITTKDIKYKEILKVIEKNKENLEYVKLVANTDEDFEISNDEFLNDRIFKAYLKKQKKNFALDFNDLINYTFFIFEEYPKVLEKWQERLHYIQVDETQDSSNKQFALVEMLSNKHKNLFVVGDPDQTIYEWRGAKPEILVNFDKIYPNSKTIILDENYRSTPEILTVGNSIIKNNKLRVEKEMFTKNKNGIKVVHFHGKNELEEGSWIVNTIKKLQESGVSLKDIAILYRANYVSRYIEQSLIREDIRYSIFGGVRFFERKEIKDSLAYLRLILLGDDISFLRVYNEPRRGLGKKFIENLSKKASDENITLYNALRNNLSHKNFNIKGAYSFVELIESSRQKIKELSVSDLLQYVLDKSEIIKQLREEGDEDRLENIKELISSIIFYETESGGTFSLNDYLQEIALYTDMDFKEDKNWIKLMTIHTSKGLEFPYVFLCGVSEGILPSYMTLIESKGRGLEEERRLIYVAITRAMKGLYITESEGYNYNTGNKYPSRFIFEINENNLVKEGEIDNELFQEYQQYISNTKLISEKKIEFFSLNELVLHPIFGKGIITLINEKNQEYLIKFENYENFKPINMNFKNMQRYVINNELC